MEYITHSALETEELGVQLARRYKAPHIFCLTGDLGAGKTALTRGIARGYGFAGRVTSPTFTLMHVYTGSETICHFDLYRLHTEEELDDIGFESYLRNGIAVIEWPDAFFSRIGHGTLVRLTYAGDTVRRITVEDI